MFSASPFVPCLLISVWPYKSMTNLSMSCACVISLLQCPRSGCRGRKRAACSSVFFVWSHSYVIGCSIFKVYWCRGFLVIKQATDCGFMSPSIRFVFLTTQKSLNVFKDGEQPVKPNEKTNCLIVQM